MNSKEPSDLTRILVNKIHGGKENAREFWEEEQQNSEKSYNVEIPKPDKEPSKNRYLIPFSSLAGVFAIAFIIVALKPELFPFLDRKWVHDRTVKKYVDSTHQPSATKSRPVKKETHLLNTRPPVASSQHNTPAKQSNFSNVNGLEVYSTSGKVFSWTDKNGKRHFSNTTYPADNPSLTVETEINTFSKVTPVRIEGNNIYVPVTLGNNGKSATFHMLLDTGCSHTNIPYKYLARVGAKYGKSVTMTVANGSKSIGRITTLDYLSIGSRTERNFTVTGSKVAGSANRGLVGMDFLKHNPFKIDFEGQFIVWM